MKILILGGTLFVGRQYVGAALAKNHDVTLFHRGRLNTEKVENVTHVLGDREKDLARLGTQQWDIIIDTCCYVPRVMRLTMAALKNKTKHYLFVSTISVYQSNNENVIDEDALKLPLLEHWQDDNEDVADAYGQNKLACEWVLREAMPQGHLIVRPGLITGPFDVTNRINYWLERFEQGGQVLAVRDKHVPLQWIDVRDLCEWSLGLAEQHKVGTYNVVGPENNFTTGQLFALCQRLSQSDAQVTYLPQAFVDSHQAPHFVPGGLGLWPKRFDCLSQINCQKARDAGLTFRSPETTLWDTFVWSAQWGHEYLQRVSGEKSDHRDIAQTLKMEQQMFKDYQQWTSPTL